MPIAANLREQIVTTAAAAIERYHFDAAQGTAIAGSLREHLRNGDYNEARTALALTSAVDQTLAAFHDRHLGFGYSADSQPLGFEDEHSAAQIETERNGWRAQGFGIVQVERLPENVGLLRIDRLPRPEIGGAAFEHAIELVQGTHALILDLRHNSGGDSDMAAFVTSLFLSAERIHISDFQRRGSTEARWSSAFTPATRYHAPVYILTGRETYSGGEAIAFHLRALRGAKIIGEQTRGGSHPARWLVIDPHFAVHIPWGRTLDPRTNRDWEGNGVAPDITVPAQDALLAARRQALRDLIATTPLEQHADLERALANLPSS